PFVPGEGEPAEAVEDRRQRGLDVALLIGVVDAQHVLAAVAACEEPVEQRRAHPADVEEAGRAGREARAGRAHEIFVPGGGASPAASKVTMRPPAAKIIPSERPNFICRGFRLTTTM